jgi:hypothetical protein
MARLSCFRRYSAFAIPRVWWISDAVFGSSPPDQGSMTVSTWIAPWEWPAPHLYVASDPV